LQLKVANIRKNLDFVNDLLTSVWFNGGIGIVSNDYLWESFMAGENKGILDWANKGQRRLFMRGGKEGDLPSLERHETGISGITAVMPDYISETELYDPKSFGFSITVAFAENPDSPGSRLWGMIQHDCAWECLKASNLPFKQTALFWGGPGFGGGHVTFEVKTRDIKGILNALTVKRSGKVFYGEEVVEFADQRVLTPDEVKIIVANSDIESFLEYYRVSGGASTIYQPKKEEPKEEKKLEGEPVSTKKIQELLASVLKSVKEDIVFKGEKEEKWFKDLAVEKIEGGKVLFTAIPADKFIKIANHLARRLSLSLENKDISQLAPFPVQEKPASAVAPNASAAPMQGRFIDTQALAARSAQKPGAPAPAGQKLGFPQKTPLPGGQNPGFPAQPAPVQPKPATKDSPPPQPKLHAKMAIAADLFTEKRVAEIEKGLARSGVVRG